MIGYDRLWLAMIGYDWLWLAMDVYSQIHRFRPILKEQHPISPRPAKGTLPAFKLGPIEHLKASSTEPLLVASLGLTNPPSGGCFGDDRVGELGAQVDLPWFPMIYVYTCNYHNDQFM